MDVGGPGEGSWAGLGRARIVVSRCVDERDAVVTQAARLLQKEPLRREGETLGVEQVPCHQKGVDILAHGQVHGGPEYLAGRLPEPFAYGLGATGEGRVEMDVGDMDETHTRR